MLAKYHNTLASGHFIEVVKNEILCYHSKRCIQNNIFMLMADYVNIKLLFLVV